VPSFAELARAQGSAEAADLVATHYELDGQLAAAGEMAALAGQTERAAKLYVQASKRRADTARFDRDGLGLQRLMAVPRAAASFPLSSNAVPPVPLPAGRRRLDRCRRQAGWRDEGGGGGGAGAGAPAGG
jgi:hypothetical protein